MKERGKGGGEGEETKQPRAFQVLVVPGRVVVRRSGPDRFLPLLPLFLPLLSRRGRNFKLSILILILTI